MKQRKDPVHSTEVNPRQEKFCLYYFSGMSQAEAARQAGYSTKWVRAGATRLTQLPAVAKRLAELRAQLATKEVMSIQERKERLSEIGRAKLVNFVDQNGNIVTDGDNNAALQEIVIEDWRGEAEGVESRTKRVKLHNPMQAIDLLNKMDKIYIEEPTGFNNYIQINIVTRDEKAKELVGKILAGERLLANGHNDTDQSL